MARPQSNSKNHRHNKNSEIKQLKAELNELKSEMIEVRAEMKQMKQEMIEIKSTSKNNDVKIDQVKE